MLTVKTSAVNVTFVLSSEKISRDDIQGHLHDVKTFFHHKEIKDKPSVVEQCLKSIYYNNF